MDKTKQMKIKQRIKQRIAPVGLVPVATGTAFLIMGSKSMDSCPGHPSLPMMLLFAGTLTLSLGVMTNVGKLIVAYGLPSDRPFTRQEKHVVGLFRYVRHFLSLTQIILLIAGTVVIAPLASTIHPWNWNDPKVSILVVALCGDGRIIETDLCYVLTCFCYKKVKSDFDSTSVDFLFHKFNELQCRIQGQGYTEFVGVKSYALNGRSDSTPLGY